MQLVVEISEDTFFDLKKKQNRTEVDNAVLNGTALPKGHWVKHDTGHSTYYDCSLCGCLAPCTETADSFIWKLSNFCPDCGAKMIGLQESEG